jgi:GNAT superfamily N-acetyltransferase
VFLKGMSFGSKPALFPAVFLNLPGLVQYSQVMKIKPIKNRSQLADYFHQDILLHLYSLGDLDDFYWPNTSYYGIQTSKGIDKVVLLYQGEGLPILLALSKPGELDEEYIAELVQIIPPRVYAHLSPGLEEIFSKTYSIVTHGSHYKMGLVDYSQIEEINITNIVPITENDLAELQFLYQISYPGNAFDPRMILTGQYFGYRMNNRLLSVGGVHVYSPAYRVAALGNITTHPDFRNQGFGKAVTAKLCLSLRDKVDVIGLNVKQDNQAALCVYQSLGFNISVEYGEFSLKKRL